MTPIAPPLWRRRWAGPAVVAAAFLAMFVWTWQTWADLLVDFGVQLYVPWQLSQGKVLYRDIAHYTGPLSVYYNALAFRIFGANLRVLEFANLPILIGIVIAIYWLASRLGGRLCAVICGVSFIILFAFAHLTVAGNYNFVTPYEYEYTHGTLLSLLSIIFLFRLIRTGRKIDAAIAGLLAGLVFLTRSEFFVAIAGASALGLTFFALAHRKAFVTAAMIFLFSACVPPILSILLLRTAMPWPIAIRGTLGMWPMLFEGKVTAQYFYQHSMGLDDLPRSLRLLSAWCAAWCILIAGFTALATLFKSKPLTPYLVAAFLLGAVFAGWQWRERDWLSLFRPIPSVAIAVVVGSLIQFRRHRDKREQPALAGMLGIFSLILLAKVFLYARIVHYGCWLAMPAVMMLLIALFGWIPELLRRRGGSDGVFLAGIGGAWTVVLLVFLAITSATMKTLNTTVGLGNDQFRADAVRGPIVNNAILAAEQIPPDKTLTCFPEGIMINYLARRQTSTRYVNFNPPDLLLFGEDRILEALQASPPDYIFIVHKDTSEFGERFFGRDYGQKIFQWIVENYQEQPLPMLDLGAQPLRDSRFGIRLMVPRLRADEGPRLIYGPEGLEKAAVAAASISARR